jgi:hypothetical protein
VYPELKIAVNRAKQSRKRAANANREQHACAIRDKDL